MSAPPPRRPFSRDHSSNASKRIDESVARTVLQACIQMRAMHVNAANPVIYVPRMDLYDDETLPYISALLELPGILREDISVVVRDSKLVITGQRRSPLASRLGAMSIHTHDSMDTAGTTRTRAAAPPIAHNQSRTEHGLNPDKYRLRELKFGKFHREIEIPSSTKTADVYAEMQDGMLLLSWPRSLAPAPAGSATIRSISASSRLRTT